MGGNETTQWVPHPRHPNAVPPSDTVVVDAELSLTLDEQMAIFDEYASRAYEMALDSMAANYQRITDLARARMTSGFERFGGRMFDWANETLHSEAMEEYADAVNYWIAIMWRNSNRGR